jgi:uncharacterized protein (TIGR02588 family)
MAAKRRQKTEDVPLLERIAGAIGFIIVAGTLSFIAYEVFRDERDRPDLRVEIGSISEVSGGHSVEIVVRNAGRQAAAGVTIEGTSRNGAEGGIRRETQLDFVPGLSEREATLVFPIRPDRASLEVRVVSFTSP